MSTRVVLEIGDVVSVGNNDFVITGLSLSLNEPPALFVQSPVELMEEKR